MGLERDLCDPLAAPLMGAATSVRLIDPDHHVDHGVEWDLGTEELRRGPFAAARTGKDLSWQLNDQISAAVPTSNRST